jgi:5,10-methylenetetrahydromethanopterin reductase
MIAETSFTASEGGVKNRIAALRDAGYSQFTIQLVPGHEAAIEGLGPHSQGFRMSALLSSRAQRGTFVDP